MRTWHHSHAAIQGGGPCAAHDRRGASSGPSMATFVHRPRARAAGGHTSPTRLPSPRRGRKGAGAARCGRGAGARLTPRDTMIERHHGAGGAHQSLCGGDKQGPAGQGCCDKYAWLQSAGAAGWASCTNCGRGASWAPGRGAWRVPGGTAPSTGAGEGEGKRASPRAGALSARPAASARRVAHATRGWLRPMAWGGARLPAAGEGSGAQRGAAGGGCARVRAPLSSVWRGRSGGGRHRGGGARAGLGVSGMWWMRDGSPWGKGGAAAHPGSGQVGGAARRGGAPWAQGWQPAVGGLGRILVGGRLNRAVQPAFAWCVMHRVSDKAYTNAGRAVA